MFAPRVHLISLCAFALLAAGCGNRNPMTLDVAGAGEEEQETADMNNPQVAFLQQNAQKEGVIVRPSGLQVRVVKMGDGNIPTKYSTVTALYHGTLIDGTVFDTTRTDGRPFSFTLDSVIEGWKEAMMLMRVGSIFEIVIPAELAYSDVGAGDTIPPGATLIFEVELIAVTNPLKPAS